MSCIEIKIDNCSVPDVNSRGPDFKCIQCDVGFYVNSTFTCTAVPSQIEYCGIYESESTCQLCFNNYVLVSNKKKCILSNTIENFIDKNCLNSYISPEPICNLCDVGYYFEVPNDKLLLNPQNDQIATRASTGLLSPGSGREVFAKVGLLQDQLEEQLSNKCVACPNNQEGACIMCYPKNPSFCMMCNSGYTHDSDGTCTLTEPKPPVEEPELARVLSAVFALAFILMMINE